MHRLRTCGRRWSDAPPSANVRPFLPAPIPLIYDAIRAQLREVVLAGTFKAHPTAIVESDSIGEGTSIWAYSHVLQGASVGRRCNIGDHCYIESGSSIGDDVTIKNLTAIWEGVVIENGVFIGPGVTFTNDIYPRSPRTKQAEHRYSGREWLAKTVVGEGATLGAGSIVLAGLTIGAHAFVGAGAVVTHDVPPLALVMGQPGARTGLGLRLRRPPRVCAEAHDMRDVRHEIPPNGKGSGDRLRPPGRTEHVISSLATRVSRGRAREARPKNRGVVMLLGNNPYPQDERVRREALTLVEHGYTVSVICPRAHGQPAAETVRGVHVYRYERRIRPKGTVGYVLEYIHAPLVALRVSVRVLRRHGFDVVHAHNPPDTLVFVGAIYKFLLGKRFVFDHHDIAPEMYAARFGPRARRIVFESLVLMERISCRLADRVIATNESYREIESRRGGVPTEKIWVVRNGPDLADLEPVTPDASLRAKAETILGYLGVMGFQDGVENFLDALHVLVYDLGRVDTLAVFVGDGDARADLERLATERGLDEHVLFTGFLDYDEWRRILSTADVCVVPDPSNPYNDRSTIVKIMDYMALGKPIVAFDLPEHRVTANGAVSFVPANDVRALAVRIAELMDDPARRSAMGAQARRRARGALCWPSSADALVDSYGALFSTSARSRESGRTRKPRDPGTRRDEDDTRLRPRGGEGRANIA